MSNFYKKAAADLRKFYIITLETALVIVLLIFLGAFKINWAVEPEKIELVETQEVVEMKEVIQTEQTKAPPPPPRPAVPVEVPNDEIIEEQAISIDAELNLEDKLEVPPPPEEPEKEEEDASDFFVVVEKMPELKGGLASIQNKIKYPELARKAGIEGRVIVQFIVNEKGKVENPVVLRGIGGGCDKEALRVVRQAEFSPGMQRGRPVRVRYTLPVIFRLEG